MFLTYTYLSVIHYVFCMENFFPHFYVSLKIKFSKHQAMHAIFANHYSDVSVNQTRQVQKLTGKIKFSHLFPRFLCLWGGHYRVSSGEGGELHLLTTAQNLKSSGGYLVGPRGCTPSTPPPSEFNTDYMHYNDKVSCLWRAK